MPSERDGWRRLHPSTLIFALGRHAYASRAVLLPAIVALAMSQRRSATGGWQDFQVWLLLPVPLLLVYELVQYFTLAYRFAEHDVVVTRGLYWKRERHIPYARVQNIELVQHAAHRLVGVAAVRLDTGSGAGAEGELAVLSLAAVAELREAVRIGRRGHIDAGQAPDASTPGVLIALGPRELLLHGLLTASGWVVIAAAAGAWWQIDFEAWGLGRFLPSTEGLWGGLRGATPTLALEIGVLIVAAMVIFRLFSAVWSAVKHFEFTLTARGEELFQSYGLLTRVGRTIPRSRIQKLTISQAPLMRLFGRARVTVDTAASVSEQHQQQPTLGSHVLVPIVPASRLAALIRDVHPAGAGAAAAPDLDALDWHGVDPRAFRRLVRVRLVAAAIVGAASYGALHRWAILVGLVVATAVVLQSWVTARFTAFAWSGDTLCFRSATATRHLTLVRAGRIQVVTREQSPLDRRWGMAAVRVDTAGAAGGGHHVHIRWLPIDVADALYARLRHAAR